jgi:CheY-like chemotaxis protein
MGKKILLADDSITIQKVIELTFSDEDFEVVTVGNGRLALERVQEAPPDILLCDIIMPEKDGYDVCDFVKKNPALAHIPVLLLTGAFEPFDQERAARVGCDGFLAKPFEPQTLIAKVKDLLARSDKPAAAAAAPPAPPTPVAFQPAAAPATPAVPAPLPFGAPELDDEPFFSAEPEPAAAPVPVAPPVPPAPPVPVQFIPEDPFAEAAGFAPLRSEDVPVPAPIYTPPSPAYTPAPPAYTPPAAAYAPVADPEPVLKFERDAAPLAAEPVAAPTPLSEPLLPDEPEELLPLTSEEAVTLGSPAAPTPVPPPSAEPLPPAWTGATVEVPLEERAQASLDAAVPEAEPFFEEVFEEEPRAAAPPLPEPITAPDPEPEAEAEALLEAEPLPEPDPEPAAVPEPAPVAAAPVTYDQTLVDEVSFADLREAPAVAPTEAPAGASAGVAVPVDMVSQIAQRVVAQISEKVIREIAWEVIPDLAEELIKKEIERLKAELQQI